MTKAIDKNAEYKFKGYKGKWYFIAESNGYYMFEHCTYGDDTCHLVVNAKSRVWDNNVIKARAIETYDDIKTTLYTEGILL